MAGDIHIEPSKLAIVAHYQRMHQEAAAELETACDALRAQSREERQAIRNITSLRLAACSPLS